MLIEPSFGILSRQWHAKPAKKGMSESSRAAFAKALTETFKRSGQSCRASGAGDPAAMRECSGHSSSARGL